jgi:uncharacterized protein (DUF1778 family)
VSQTKRNKQIGVSLTEDEYKAIREAAFQAEKSISHFIRESILKKIKFKEVKNG